MSTPTNPYAPATRGPRAAVKASEEPKAPEPVEEPKSPEDVPDGPAAEILAWVGEDSARAQRALDAEEAGQQRVGLTKKLKELV